MPVRRNYCWATKPRRHHIKFAAITPLDKSIADAYGSAAPHYGCSEPAATHRAPVAPDSPHTSLEVHEAVDEQSESRAPPQPPTARTIRSVECEAVRPSRRIELTRSRPALRRTPNRDGRERAPTGHTRQPARRVRSVRPRLPTQRRSCGSLSSWWSQTLVNRSRLRSMSSGRDSLIAAPPPENHAEITSNSRKPFDCTKVSSKRFGFRCASLRPRPAPHCGSPHPKVSPDTIVQSQDGGLRGWISSPTLYRR